MEDIQKKLLDIIQTAFPLSPRPYETLGNMLGISEEEAFKQVRAMQKDKIIRRLGANFDSKKLGFRSTLCAAKVPKDNIADFVECVNSYSGVTHNYLRKHDYNIWFTFIGSSWEVVENTLAEMTDKTGIPILNLPATKLFKIRVDFKISSSE